MCCTPPFVFISLQGCKQTDLINKGESAEAEWYEYYRLYIKRLRIFSAKQKIDADKLINVLNEVVESCHICYSLAFKATEDHDPHVYSRLAHYTGTLYQRIVPSMSDFYSYLQKL